jgi:Holliday junction resolvase
MDEPMRLSQRQEKSIAKRTGGSRNAGSGNGWQRKHDVRSGGREGVLWEMKRTAKKSISIKADDLESLRKIAWSEGRSPMFHFELGGRGYIILEEHDVLDEHHG